MKSESDAKKKNKKLPYEKPKIVSIELMADEVLAVGCKTINGGGPGIPFVHCSNQGCLQIGS